MIRELIDAKEKAQESDRLKTAFLQNMSHEIRTPMNAIIGFSDLLPDEFSNKEKLQKYTTIIKQRSSDLLDIINEILDIARIESGQFPINPAKCDLHAMFNELEIFFDEFRERIHKQHIGLKLHCSREVKEIVTDPVKLRQVLINLISNAFKFTHEGKVEVRCEVIAGNQILFSVSDTGIGIPENKMAEIFERFKQANTDTTKLYGGTGLGLSIVKGILDLLGGSIRVESRTSMGSTFRFTIPDMALNPRGLQPVGNHA
jgi:signal transduction histidine kinase